MKMEKVSLDSRNDAVNWQRFDGNLMACRARQKDWKLNCHDNIMDSRFSYLFYRPKLYIYILFFANSVLKHVKTWHLFNSVEAISPKPSCLFWPIIHRRERFWPLKMMSFVWLCGQNMSTFSFFRLHLSGGYGNNRTDVMIQLVISKFSNSCIST